MLTWISFIFQNFLFNFFLNYFSWIKSKRAQKYKNIKAKYYNFANKNYNGINNDIYATDVTYIPVLIDVPDNHIFMSVIIHHQKNVALKMLTRLLRRYISKGKSID